MTEKELEKHFGTLQAQLTRNAQDKREEEALEAIVRIAQCIVTDLHRIANAMDVNRGMKN